MYNLKKMRDKYEEIKSLNPHREASVRSATLSYTPSKQQKEVALGLQKKKQPIIQIGKKLICSPCYNKRLLISKETQRKQELAMEREQLKIQIREQIHIEQSQVGCEQQLTNRRKDIEKQNLEISKKMIEEKNQLLQQQKKEQQEYDRYMSERLLENEKQEIEQRRQKIHIFSKELKQQIKQKEYEHKKQASVNVQPDDPYWKYFSQEEENLQRRRMQQSQKIQQNWSFHETEKAKQQEQVEQQKQFEYQQRIKTLEDEKQILLQEKKQKQQQQKALIMDLNSQINQKHSKYQSNKISEQQKQREFDQQQYKREQERLFQEQSYKKKMDKQMLNGLQSQLQYKSQQNDQSFDKQSQSSFILKSSVDKVLLECDDCHKKQNPYQLSQL